MVGRDKAQKLKKRGERHVSLVPTLDTLPNVIENDVCALSMSYLFASKTRGFDRIGEAVNFTSAMIFIKKEIEQNVWYEYITRWPFNKVASFVSFVSQNSS